MSEAEDAPKSSGSARVVTALVGAPLVLGAIYLGGYWLLAVVLAIAVISSLEVGAMFEKAGAKPFVWVALVLVILVVARFWIPVWAAMMGVAVTLLLAAIPFIPGENVPTRTAITFFVAIYPAWLLSFLINIRLGVGLDMADDVLMRISVLVVFLVWASDTFAYYTGRAVGRTPFFPSVSPKKTWEGFAGGLVGTIAISLVALFAGLAPISTFDAVGLAVICGLATPVGDLIESKLKRSFGVKDSGSILPGHGGVLDRFDGMVLSVPLVWGWLVYL